jgi:CheY-like chemotaxis protein/HPt (histidine-containing phosphotransfer) domain-containing protein
LLDAAMPGADGFGLAQEINHRRETAPTIIMMLSSMDRPEEISRCRAVGVERYLIKPIGQSELLDALLRRADAAGPAETTRPAGLELAPRVSPLRVLLAEDNSVNRELASTVLQKLGHSVEAVWNGQEVLDSWKDGGFDLILMDVQMPILDGLETTARIRQQEAVTGEHIPIIGLTAHAMKGDREHGLAAGMDEYLTKPLQLEDLARAIEKLAPREKSAARETRAAFDPAQLLRSFGGDKAALRRLVGLFVESTPPIIESIRLATHNRDARALHQAAHTLKGSLTLFEDVDLRRAAADLERHVRTGDTNKAVETASRLVRILEPFQESLRRWLNGGA